MTTTRHFHYDGVLKEAAQLTIDGMAYTLSTSSDVELRGILDKMGIDSESGTVYVVTDRRGAQVRVWARADPTGPVFLNGEHPLVEVDGPSAGP